MIECFFLINIINKEKYMKELKFEYSITEKEFVSFEMWYRYVKKYINTFLYIIYEVVFLFFIIVSIIQEKWFLTIYSLIFFVFILIRPFLNKRKLGKIYRNDKLYHENVYFLLSESGIKITTEQSEVIYKWDDVFEISDNKNYIIIYYSKIRFNYIPKNRFQNEQLIKLVALFKTYLPSNKIKLKYDK